MAHETWQEEEAKGTAGATAKDTMNSAINQVNEMLKSKGIDLESLVGSGNEAMKPYLDKAKGYYSTASELATPYVNDLMEKVTAFKDSAMEAIDTDGDGQISFDEAKAAIGKAPGLLMSLIQKLFGMCGGAANKATTELPKVLEGVDKMMQDKLGIDLGKYLHLNPNIDTTPDAAPTTAPDTATAPTETPSAPTAA